MAKQAPLRGFHGDAVLTTAEDASSEEVLKADDIQGNIVPGFGTSTLRFVSLRLAEDDTSRAREWLRSLAPSLSTLAQTNVVREVRRAVARATKRRQPMPDVLLNAAISFDMMRRLELPVDHIVDTPLKQGMARTGLGDPRDENGVPIGWKFGATDDTTPHVLLIVGSDDGETAGRTADQLIGNAAGAGFTAIYSERGDRLPNNEEHFGFRDDISQPGVRGRLSPRPDHVLTRRYFDPTDERAQRFARPGQPLLWAGQFIFGYATQIDDDPGPGPVAIPPHPWMANGSCLVFRRLRQRVQAFREFAERCAAAATVQLGRVVEPNEIQAWLVGRWPDGTPLSRSPTGPDFAVSNDRMSVNFFDYFADESDARLIEQGVARTVPGTGNDSSGLRCPHFAHIRKVNPRSRGSDQGPSSRFSILRRGIPYGPPVAAGEPPDVDRGLLFVSYQRRIDPQFKTIVATWMNSEDAPEGDFGHDLLVGQRAAGRSAKRRDANGQVSVELSSPPTDSWVVPTGGGFFFSPAVSVFGGL